MSSEVTIVDTYLPEPIPTIVHGFCTVHRWFRGYQRALEITSSPLHLILSGAGFATNCCLGDCACVRISSRATLLARRIVECIEAQYALVHSFKKIENAYQKEISDPYPYVDHHSWTFLSNSRAHDLNCLIERIIKIFKRIAEFCTNLFILSMSYISLIDAFSQDESVTTEAIEDVFLNAEYLLGKIKQYENEIHSTLFSLGARYNIVPLTDCIEASVSACSGLFDICSFINDQFVAIGNWFCSTPPLKTIRATEVLPPPKTSLRQILDSNSKGRYTF